VKKRFDAISIGYTALDYLGVVPHFPRENHKLEMLRFAIQGGGPAATAAVTMKRLGLSVGLVAKVGGDLFGRRMLDELIAEGVDVSAVVEEPDAESQFAFIMVDERTADRTILWTRGNLTGLGPDEIDLETITASRGLLVDSLEPAAAEAAARAANEHGIPVVIDAGTLREGVSGILPFCDYIVASEVFAGQIAPGKGVDAALEAILACGPKGAVVTLGERGCAAHDGGRRIDVPGFAVETVDTTGAGDVFHGAFLFAVLQGWDLHRACVFSNAVAALKCRELGGRKGIPDLEGALTFLKTEMPDLDFS
jgi:ribokinase